MQDGGCYDIIALGHVVKETICFPDRETELVLGSPPAYSMVTAGRLGAKVGLVTRLGDDMPPHLLQPFRDADVCLEGMVRKGPTTATRLVYHADQTKTIEYLVKADPIRPEDIPEAYQSARLFYDCPMDHDLHPDTLRFLQAKDGLFAADLGGYGGAHVAKVEREPGLPDGFAEVVGHFDIVKVSDEDCRRLTADRTVDVEAFAHRLLAFGATVSILTLGDRGALIFTEDQQIRIPAYDGEVVDPTGAGDTFMGGFLVAYLKTNDLEYAGRFGSATALLVIENSGGVQAARMPTLDQVEERMKHQAASD